MSGKLRWWVTPGALLVLTGVLTFGTERPSEHAPRPETGDSLKTGSENDSSGAPTSGAPTESLPAVGAREVMVRDATGQRSAIAFGHPSETLVLAFPQRFVGKRVELTLWRCMDGRRETTPWITLSPKVREDTTVPMAGVVAGIYDIECAAADEPDLCLQGVRSPGSAQFGMASPPR